jgi:hypothetical protein
MVWCLFHCLDFSLVGSLPAIFQIPIVIGLLLFAWPLLLLALLLILILIFPGLASEHSEVPRLLLVAVSNLFLYFPISVALPLSSFH